MSREAWGGDGVRVLSRHHNEVAARFLFECYARDPAFLRLHGLRRRHELAGLRPVFDDICRISSLIRRTMFGCHRGGELVGVIAYCPTPEVSLWGTDVSKRALAPLPLVRRECAMWRCRPWIERIAMKRWQAYSRMTQELAGEAIPKLIVMAVAVLESARGQGVARRLLDAVADEPLWRGRVRAIEVTTWDAVKVAIYERLGFETVAHGKFEDLDCWAMHRAIG